ncbi:hypothetical protein JCM10207_002634 [Rhodosporidiobolus poonsookiae]
MDALIQFLLEEIAFDADAGTSVRGLADLISQFYASAPAFPSSSASTSTTPASFGPATQLVDDAFVGFVWDTLVQQDDVRVGVLSPIAAPAEEEGGEKREDGDAEGAKKDEDGEEEQDKAGKGKGKAVASKRVRKKPLKAMGPTHEMRFLDGAEREEGRERLVEKYGENVRVLVGEETAWAAITGSHTKISSITPTIFGVLKMIARGRNEGTTAVRISKELGIEPKSVFHCIKVPTALGLTKKFPDIDEGCRTNRILHVRYLSSSPLWAVYNASDPTADDGADGDGDGDGEDDDDDLARGEDLMMPPISQEYLTTNRPLIRARVIKVLKRRREGWIAHAEIAPSIGLHASSSLNLRRLNTIITEMAREPHPLFVKGMMTRDDRGTQFQVLHLVREKKEEEDEDEDLAATPSQARPAPAQHADKNDDDDETDDASYPVYGKSIDRQVLDLLINAGGRGMTGNELAHSLGSFAVRFIDAVLMRLSRGPPPSHLSDHALHAATETVGRVKRTRWFTRAGYLAFRRAQGVPDDEGEGAWGAQEGAWSEKVAGEGGWAEASPWEGQLRGEKEKRRKWSDLNTMQMVGAAGAGKGKKKADGDAAAEGTKKKKAPAKKEDGAAAKDKGKVKGKGKEKAPADAASATESDSPPPAPKPKPKTLGRPRKNPLPKGMTESPYMRRKREKAEDEERERLGLPPIERRRAVGGRKVKKEGEGEATPGPSSSAAPGTPADTPIPKKKPGRPKKQPVPAMPAGAESGVEDQSDGSAVESLVAKEPGPPPKKAAMMAAALSGSAPPSQSATPAPSSPAATPAPAPAVADGKGADAGADAADEPEPSPAAESPAPAATPAPVTPSAPKATPTSARRLVSLKRSRLEPYIDIELRPRTPAKRTKAATGSSPASKGKTVETDPTQGSTEAGPSSAATAAQAPPVTPLGTSTPVKPKGTPTKTPRQTDKRKALAKDNVALLLRQREILDYCKAQGGIFERVFRSHDFIRDWVVANGGQKHAMDRPVFDSVVNTMINREALRKTVTTDKYGKRRDILYLPSITLDGPEMAAFLTEVNDDDAKKREQARRNRFTSLTGRQHGESVLKGEDDLPDQAFDEPEPLDGHDAAQEFFRAQPNILGRSHGLKHGLFVRARQLHKWLGSFVFSQPEGSAAIALADDKGFVVAQQTLLNSMPLGVFVRVVPLPVQSDKLDAFLANPENHSIAMGSLPAEIDKIIQPRANKRKQALWKVLTILVKLGLFDRLCPSTGKEGGFTLPVRDVDVTHWRFCTTVPLYLARRDTAPLVGVHQLSDINAVADYWTDLHAASERSLKPHGFEPTQHDGFPSNLSSTALVRDLQNESRWKDMYQLVTAQRTFLAKLYQHDPDLVDGEADRSEDVKKWATCVYAPYETVDAYFCVCSAKAHGTHQRRPRKKRRAFIDEDGNELAEGDGAGQDDDPTPYATLQRKIRDAASQRERDWTGIVERFRTEHGQPDLDASIVDFLHRRFIDPRRQIDARQLDFELRRLLPEPTADQPAGPAPVAPAPPPDQAAFKTVVPMSLIRKARLAKDPYAVTRQPNLRKRVRAVRSKAPPQSGSVPRQGKSFEPFETGDPSEFLDMPLAPRPQLEKGQRLSRHFYTAEQDELLIDACAILKARAQYTEQAYRVGALEQLFPGHKAAHLNIRAKRVLDKPEEGYHARLVNAWLEVYKEKKAELDDPNPTSMTKFNLAAFVKCLRQNVDKRLIRLMRAMPEALAPAVSLPATLSELDASYKVKEGDHATKPAERYHKAWARQSYATNVREDSVAAVPFSKPFSSEKVDSASLSTDMTYAALKTLLTTSDEKYDADQGKRLLSEYEGRVDDAVKVLDDRNVIVRAHAEEGRVLPGRNYSYSDKYLERFDDRVDMERMASASHYEQDLHKTDSDNLFPLIPTTGEMMAFFDLLSEGKLEVTIDTSTLTEKTLDNADYLTRQANDDDIECNVVLEAIGQRAQVLPVPELQPPQSAFGDYAAAKEALQQVQDKRILALAVQLETQIAGWGVEGMPYALLSAAAARPDILAALDLLTSPSSGAPLVFIAGFSHLKLVSSLHFEKWTLALPPPVVTEGADPVEGRRILPSFWFGLDGELNLEMWQRAAGWVKGELMTRAGASFPQLASKAVTRHLLTAYEVQRILDTLVKAGKVVRRRAGTGEELGADKMVDWQHDGFFLAGGFW